MSKKHFIALADVIIAARRANKNGCSTGMFQNGEVLEIAEFCKSQNSDFNRECWIAYIDEKCGSSGGKLKAK